MPAEQVPLHDGAAGVANKITELENGGARIISVAQVGDHHLIVWERKPKVGRPPKMETR